MIKQLLTLQRQPKSLWLFFVGLLFLPILACNSIVPLNNVPPTENRLEGTIVAMQATLQTIEEQQISPTASPTARLIVVTATSTPTPIASATPLPTSTPMPTPTSTASHTPVPQSRTIVIVVTPTSPPTATSYPEAPITIAPHEQAVVAKGREILLHWSWNGLLVEPNQYFEVKLRPDGQSRSVYIAQERGQAHNLKANLGDGRYLWTVQIVQGHFINNSGHADDWVFEGFRSPESAPRMIIVNDDRSPRSRSQAEPPHRKLPVGIALGAFAFAAFAAVTGVTKRPAQ